MPPPVVNVTVKCSPLWRGWPLHLQVRLGVDSVLPAQAGVAPWGSSSTL